MKSRLLPTLILLILLLVSCAPATVQPESSSYQPAAVEPSPTAFLPSEPTLISVTETAVVPTESATPLPIATSRGPELHATSPGTVNLASGGLQFIEFFRFT